MVKGNWPVVVYVCVPDTSNWPGIADAVTVPCDDFPSPQLMAAVKSLKTAPGFESRKAPTVPVNEVDAVGTNKAPRGVSGDGVAVTSACPLAAACWLVAVRVTVTMNVKSPVAA